MVLRLRWALNIRSSVGGIYVLAGMVQFTGQTKLDSIAIDDWLGVADFISGNHSHFRHRSFASDASKTTLVNRSSICDQPSCEPGFHAHPIRPTQFATCLFGHFDRLGDNRMDDDCRLALPSLGVDSASAVPDLGFDCHCSSIVHYYQ